MLIAPVRNRVRSTQRLLIVPVAFVGLTQSVLAVPATKNCSIDVPSADANTGFNPAFILEELQTLAITDS